MLGLNLPDVAYQSTRMALGSAELLLGDFPSGKGNGVGYPFDGLNHFRVY